MSRIYFTDRDLGKQFPAILTAAGLGVEQHIDLFSPQGSNEEWLEHCGRKGRVAITHDARIRYKANELKAVIDHRVALLVVVGKAPFRVLAQNFVATLQKIEVFLVDHEPPFIAKVYRPSAADIARDANAPGRIELWYPK